MCGICCVLSTSPQASTSLHSKLLSNLKKRGPDLSGAIENRVLCLWPVHKPRRRNSLADQPLCDDGDVERQQSCKEHLELNSLDHNEHDQTKDRTTIDEKEKENDVIKTRKDIATIWDGSDEGGNKASVEPTDLEEEATHTIDGQRKLCSNCDCDLVYGSFFGQVLHLRGDPTPQPVEDEQGNILLWNGEVFDGIEVHGQNDTMVLSKLLGEAKSADDVVKVMGAIRGPWSFIYWQEKNSRIWFGRDFFGRRSLLWLGDQSGAKTLTFALSSVAHKTEPKTEPCGIPVASEWKEVPACGIFCLDVSSLGPAASTGGSAEIVWYPWQQPTPKCALTPSVEPGTNQDSATSDPTPTPISQAVTISEMDSVKAPFGDVLKCVVGDCCLDNPIISPLNMQVPDETAASGLDSETRDGEGDGARDGDTVLQVSREVQENADQLIRVLGEAVRKRVTNVPMRTEALQNSPGHQFQDLHIHGTGIGSDDDFKPCLSGTEASPRMEKGDCEAAHRKEAERTKSIHKNHLDSAIHDEVNRVQRKPGHDPSTRLHVTNRTPCCHDNDPIVSSNPSLASSDRCPSSPADSGMTVSPGVGSHVHAGDVCERDGDIPTCITSSSCAICCPRETKSSRVGVLFSGGLDSIVLAALADRYVPLEEPIDLFNVAFEQRTVVQQTKGKDKKKKEKGPELQKKSFDVPDRLTGRAGLEELQTINPSRKWNFVEIDVTLEELQALRSEHLCHLIYPQDTVLDDSIGCAIWFAARGRGKLITHTPLPEEECLGEPYTSPAKVVLVGMGADEQLAGYARHRSKFKSEGWQGLLEEIKMEVDRISARNLGRDDRVISDHGRESRLPYLDEDVVSFLNSLPINLKADLNLPRGVGEKLLLRVAAQRLGLGASSKLPKRAIQFGSRIAKLENNREKASDRCRRLEQQVD